MTDDKKKHHHHLVDHDLVASWEDSVLVNRGKHPESDDIQEIVRHHRKDEDSEQGPQDQNDQSKDQKEPEFPELKDQPQKRNAA